MILYLVYASCGQNFWMIEIWADVCKYGIVQVDNQTKENST